jgi:hypothetical protein
MVFDASCDVSRSQQERLAVAQVPVANQFSTAIRSMAL